jgi:parallel beta-helix repeat protein
MPCTCSRNSTSPASTISIGRTTACTSGRPGDVTKTPVRLTLCRQPLVRADGSAYLTVRDLTIENGCDAGIVMRNGRHCRVENCLVRNTGRSGISLSGSHMAAVAARSRRSDRRDQHQRRRSQDADARPMLDRALPHPPRRPAELGGAALRILGGCGNRLAHNLFHHGPTGAVAYGGNEHVLELNEAHTMCIHYADVGVFYTGRDWASQGNVVRWNYIHDVAVKGGSGAQAIYLDDCDSGETVVGNIVYRCGNRGRAAGRRTRQHVPRQHLHRPADRHPRRWPRSPRDRLRPARLLEPVGQVRGGRLPVAAVEGAIPAAGQDHGREPASLPLGNSMHENIMIGCEKPFDMRKEVDPEWLDRANNAEWPLTEFPELFEGGPPARLNLSKLPAVWQKVAASSRSRSTRSGHEAVSATGRMVMSTVYREGESNRDGIDQHVPHCIDFSADSSRVIVVLSGKRLLGLIVGRMRFLPG